MRSGGVASSPPPAISRPRRRSRAGSRFTRPGLGDDLEIWIDRRYVPAGYGWSFPAGEETRVGVGSFDPRFHVKDTTVLLADDLERDAVRYQGNWIPHKLRRGAEDRVFFCGDSAGHCLPLTAEGIRTAFYFAIALGEELRSVVEGRKTRDDALRDYASFNDSHERKFNWMLRAQRTVPRFPARAQRGLVAAAGRKRFVDWSFGSLPRDRPPAVRGSARPPGRRRPRLSRGMRPEGTGLTRGV